MKGIDFGWEAAKKYVKLQQQTRSIFLRNVCTEDFFENLWFLCSFSLPWCSIERQCVEKVLSKLLTVGCVKALEI